MNILLVFLLSLPVFAREFKGVEMPDHIKIGEKSLTLNGMGLRKAMIIRDVYVAGLYIDDSMKPPVGESEKILSSPTTKKLRMQFLMYVPGGSMKDAWVDGFKKNSPKDFDYIKQLTQLKDVMKNFKKGDTIEMTFDPAKVEVAVNGESKGIFEGAEFSKTLLSVFIGNPPNEELKSGLLGKH